MRCERPKCKKEAPADYLYCSDRCFDLDNDPTPITVRRRGSPGDFYVQSHRNPVILPK